MAKPKRNPTDTLAEIILRGPPGGTKPAPKKPETAKAVIDDARKALRKLGMDAKTLERRLAGALAAEAYPDAAALITAVAKRGD